MKTSSVGGTQIILPDAPSIAGLTFRHYCGEQDLPLMLAVIHGSKEADEVERSDTLEEITHQYRHLSNCDPFQDVLIAEVSGQVIAYNRITWAQQDDGDRVYILFGFLLPSWRRRGIGTAMLHYAVRRPWRNRGLARSLIVQSMQMFKEMGMTETALGVDTQNLSGALHLYESCGYRKVKESITFRKPMV